MKTIKTIGTIVFILLMLWIVLSWCDVIAHNNPTDGDKRYNPLNMFVILEGVYE